MNTKQRVELNKFLDRLNSKIFVSSNRMHQSSLTNVLWRNKHTKDDAYFYVNNGTHEHEVTNVRSCFVDLDVGRDSNQKYFSDSVVTRKKKEMLSLIQTSPLKPHYIIETRNGYQVYWCINIVDMTKKSSKQTWNGTQYFIKAFFAKWADNRVGKPNQIMRLPNTIWYKSEERKKPFQVKFHATPKNFRRYTLSKVYCAFKQQVKQTFGDKCIIAQKQLSPYPPRNISPNTYQLKSSNQIQLIEQAIKALQQFVAQSVS